MSKELIDQIFNILTTDDIQDIEKILYFTIPTEDIGEKIEDKVIDSLDRLSSTIDARYADAESITYESSELDNKFYRGFYYREIDDPDVFKYIFSLGIRDLNNGTHGVIVRLDFEVNFG